MASSGPSTGTGSPCGACKFLRRKCASDCIFAPYFSSEQGPARFAAIHKVFGASNASKLLLHMPAHDRCEAVVTMTYEAQARIRDPVYGCVAHIFSLQQQVACLQVQLMQVKAQLAQNTHQCEGNLSGLFPSIPISPQTSLDSVEVELNSAADHSTMNMQEIRSIQDYFQGYAIKRACDGDFTDLGELEAIALSMMRN